MAATCNMPADPTCLVQIKTNLVKNFFVNCGHKNKS